MHKKSFGLLEVIFASAILILFLVAGILLLRGSLRGVVTGKHRMSALSLANQQMETARSIRDAAYFSGSLNLYTAFDSFGAATCYNGSGGTINPCPGPSDEPDVWGQVAKKVYTICYDEDSNQTACPAFYSVQITVTPWKMGTTVGDTVAVAVSWDDYGTEKSSTTDTYVLGCPGVSYSTTGPGPVDAVNVLDHTDSMSLYWGSPSEMKLNTAKTVLTSFNNRMIQFNTDNNPAGIYGRVGLVSYGYDDSVYAKINYTGPPPLTSINISAINTLINNFDHQDNTPIASGIKKAITVLDDTGNPGAYKAMIVASDGIANINLNGQACAMSGTTSCITDARDQANAARQKGYNVFVIAIGNDFNAESLKLIAGTDSEPYFQVASDPAALENVFDTIFTLITQQGRVQVCPGHTAT